MCETSYEKVIGQRTITETPPRKHSPLGKSLLIICKFSITKLTILKGFWT